MASTGMILKHEWQKQCGKADHRAVRGYWRAVESEDPWAVLPQDSALCM